MTNFILKSLRQDATRWAVGDPDGRGWYAFSEPEVIKVRWEEKIVEFLDDAGTSQFSNAVVHTGIDIKLGDYIFLGISEELDPKNVPDSYAIRKFDKIASLNARIINRMAYV